MFKPDFRRPLLPVSVLVDEAEEERKAEERERRAADSVILADLQEWLEIFNDADETDQEVYDDYEEWHDREIEPPLNDPVLYGEGSWEPWEQPREDEKRQMGLFF